MLAGGLVEVVVRLVRGRSLAAAELAWLALAALVFVLLSWALRATVGWWLRRHPPPPARGGRP